MDVSIVIVNWNTADHLRAAMTSCYRHGGELRTEVIVVDNGSSDDSVEMVRREFPEALVIANDENLGYVRAGNQGIRAATGRHILMLNSDAELTDGCLQELLRLMDAYPDIGTASAFLTYPDGTPQVCAFRFPTLWTRLLPAGCVHSAESIPIENGEGTDGCVDVGWVLGACQIVRAAVIADVGPMDERIFMWYDDADWCMRMRAAGYRRVVATRAVCVHKERRSAAAVPSLRRNLQVTMSEFTYFRLHHGGIVTGILWTARTVASALKTLVWAIGNLLTLGRRKRFVEALHFSKGRLWFHLKYAARILWLAPTPYRAEDF